MASVRGRLPRVVWLIAVWAALSVARTARAEEPKDSAISTPASETSSELLPKGPRGVEGSLPKGALSADTTHVVAGETVRLLLRISGGGDLRAAAFEQPTLPALTHLGLMTVSQRNEVAFRSGEQVFSTTFLYTLTARSPGSEKIPGIRVKYRAEGDRESRAIAVDGLEIVIGERRHISRRAIALIMLVVAGSALLRAAWRQRARGPKGTSGGLKAPEHGGFVAADKEKSRAAVEGLAMVEDARGLKLAGEWGHYGARVMAALSAYLEREPAAEVEKLRETVRALGERVRYARDREAEGGIEECARKAEIFFKNEIRKQLEQI